MILWMVVQQVGHVVAYSRCLAYNCSFTLFFLMYINNVHTFLLENNFQPLPNNPTKKDQTHITKTLHQCNLIVRKKQIKHLTQKNPFPPTLKAQLKLHKPGVTIRPVVNNRTAPAYRVAKKLNEIIKQRLNMDIYMIDNSTKLAHNLTKLNNQRQP